MNKEGKENPQDLLVEKAKQARTRAYVPYSHFPVGAALRTDSGRVIQGCNIENASYGLCNCAERTALFTAIAAYGKEKVTFTGLAVVADTDRPVPPCGACRQVMVELCEPEMPVYLANLQGKVDQTTVGDLLPGGFGADDLHASRGKGND